MLRRTQGGSACVHWCRTAQDERCVAGGAHRCHSRFACPAARRVAVRAAAEDAGEAVKEGAEPAGAMGAFPTQFASVLQGALSRSGEGGALLADAAAAPRPPEPECAACPAPLRYSNAQCLRCHRSNALTSASMSGKCVSEVCARRVP